MDLLLIVLIVLIIASFLGGNFFGDGAYRGPGFSLGGLLVLVLIVVLLARVL